MSYLYGPYFFRPSVPSYNHICHLTIDDIRAAIFLWDQIAKASHLEYALGSVGAKLAGQDFVVHDIEIYVRPAVMANGAHMLLSIQRNYPAYFRVTGGGHRILVTQPQERKGVCLMFRELGGMGCPEDLVPPYTSPLRTIGHGHRAPTFREVSVYDRKVPIACASLIIKQRLTLFNEIAPVTVGQDLQKFHNKLARVEIPSLLQQAITDGDPPFSPAEAQLLLPKVRAWIRYADGWFSFTGLVEINHWRRLGIAVDANDVSEGIRPTV